MNGKHAGTSATRDGGCLSNFKTVLTKKREAVIDHLSRHGKTGDADNAQIAEMLVAKLKAGGGELSSFGMSEVQVLAEAVNSTAPYERPRAEKLPPKQDSRTSTPSRTRYSCSNIVFARRLSFDLRPSFIFS